MRLLFVVQRYGAGIAGEGFPVTPGSLQGAFAGPDSLDGFVVKLLPEQGANPTPVPGKEELE